VIKEETRHASEIPVVMEVPLQTAVVYEPPTVVGSSEGSVVSSSQIDPCAEAKALEEKKRYYEELNALPDEELEARGYDGGREELKITIVNLERSIQRLRAECEAGMSSSSGGGSGVIPPTETVPVEVSVSYVPKPIAVESAVEITDYYRLRIAEIATEEADIDKQIASLKALRDEIDQLIEELIKSQDEIQAEEVRGLVARIEVRPGEVQMDEVVVKTVDKRVIARVNNKDLEIKPMEAHVIIQDENLEIKTPELSIEDEVLRTGDSEVKIMPSTIMERIRIEPEEIELKEENAKAVYRIRTNERRKLFGFIPLTVENILTIDAENTEVDIIKEERPWWAFFTTE
jgi:hypothetical protein